MIFASEQTLQIKQYEGGGEHGGVNPYLTQRKTPWKKVVEADFFYHNGEFLCKKTRIVLIYLPAYVIFSEGHLLPSTATWLHADAWATIPALRNRPMIENSQFDWDFYKWVLDNDQSFRNMHVANRDPIEKWLRMQSEYFQNLSNLDQISSFTAAYHGDMIYHKFMNDYTPDFQHKHVTADHKERTEVDADGYPIECEFYLHNDNSKTIQWMLFEKQVREVMKDYHSEPRVLVDRMLEKHGEDRNNFWKTVVGKWSEDMDKTIAHAPRCEVPVVTFWGLPNAERVDPLGEAHALHHRYHGISLCPATAAMFSRKHRHLHEKRQIWRVTLPKGTPMLTHLGATFLPWYALCEMFIPRGIRLVNVKSEDIVIGGENVSFCTADADIRDVLKALDK
jgi:hypothetical protein